MANKGLKSLAESTPNFSNQGLENAVSDLRIGWVAKSIDLDTARKRKIDRKALSEPNMKIREVLFKISSFNGVLQRPHQARSVDGRQNPVLSLPIH